MYQYTETFARLRATPMVDPYDPESVIGDWSHPDELAVVGFLSAQSSIERPDVVRESVTTAKQLCLTNPDADVRRGDLIRTPGGDLYRVQGYPAADRNPFTGWRGLRICDLEEVEG